MSTRKLGSSFLAYAHKPNSEILRKLLTGTIVTNRGGATVVKVGGYNFASGASEKFLDPPPTFGLPGGNMKQDIAVFYCNYDV